MRCSLRTLAVVVFVSSFLVLAQAEELRIPRGKPITVNGTRSPGEWDDAKRVSIWVDSEVNAEILVKHDGENLLIAFRHVRTYTREVYPRVLIDPKNARGKSWTPDQWWFSSGYQVCASQGAPGPERGCSPPMGDWDASHFPIIVDGIIEFSIPLSTLGPSVRNGSAFGIAFNVQGNQGENGFWPSMAKTERPDTWSQARLAI